MKPEEPSTSPPRVRPVMKQTWNNLLFANWQVDEQFLRREVPSRLALDRHNGKCWITVTPLEMDNVGLTGPGSLFAFKPFLELNLRTYVIHNGRPGVFFFSLETNNALAARAARLWYHLPYYRALMTMEKAETFRFSSSRNLPIAGEARFSCDYALRGKPFESKRGSIEEWLTERYCLFSIDRRDRVMSAGIRHRRWLLQRATAKIRENTLPHFPEKKQRAGKPLFLFSQTLDVDIWAPRATDNTQPESRNPE